MGYAQFVAIAAAGLATIACVISVFACWRAWFEAKKIRGTSSALGELHEIRDYVGKIDQWSKRINSRLVMQERRDAPESDGDAAPARTTPRGGLERLSKAELRKVAGIVPGQYPKHGA